MLNLQSFNGFPDESRIWIYAFKRALTADERVVVENQLSEFVKHWKSHGDIVSGGYIIIENIFVILAIHPDTDVSGCSIDSSVAVFKRLRDEFGLDALDRRFAFYRDGAAVAALEKSKLENLVNSGQISPTTLVFDASIQTLGDLRSGKFEIPLRESWLSQATF